MAGSARTSKVESMAQEACLGDHLVNLMGIGTENDTYEAGAPDLKARLNSPPIRAEILLRTLPVAALPARAKPRFHILYECSPSLVSLGVYTSKITGAHEPHADVPSNCRKIGWIGGRGDCADLVDTRKRASPLMMLQRPCSSLKRDLVASCANAGKTADH